MRSMNSKNGWSDDRIRNSGRLDQLLLGHLRAQIAACGKAVGAFDGSRLNKLYRQDVGHDEVVAVLTPLI